MVAKIGLQHNECPGLRRPLSEPDPVSITIRNASLPLFADFTPECGHSRRDHNGFPIVCKVAGGNGLFAHAAGSNIRLTQTTVLSMEKLNQPPRPPTIENTSTADRRVR